jgi:hypothetical protein
MCQRQVTTTEYIPVSLDHELKKDAPDLTRPDQTRSDLKSEGGLASRTNLKMDALHISSPFQKGLQLS